MLAIRSRPRSLLPALAGASLALACHGSSSGPGTVAPPFVGNTGLAVHYSVGRGPLWILLVNEEAQGPLDLNGDGDATDDVVHVADLATGSVVNTGLATAPFPWVTLDTRDIAPPNLAASEELAAFGVSEEYQGGTDLNGDGDALDYVLHVYDRASGGVRNAGLAIGSYLAPGEHLVPVQVAEAAQGGMDLDGDGDALDAVLHVYDARADTSENLGRSDAYPYTAVGELVVLTVNEGGQVDWTGDGDEDDLYVLQLLDVRTGAILNSGLSMWTVREAGGLWGVIEMTSRQFHVWDPATGEVRDTGLVGRLHYEPYQPYVASEENILLEESGNDALHVFEPLTRSLVATGLATRTAPAEVGTWLLALEPLGRVGAFDLASHEVRDLGQSHLGPGAAGAHGLLFPSEAAAFVDWNGDGDMQDVILHVWDAPSGRIRNTGEATLFGLGLGPDAALLLASERDERIDANQDGDRDDGFFKRIDLRSDDVEVLPLAVSGFTFSAHGRTLVFVLEQGQGTDLNGDGDLADQVLHVVEQP